MVDIANALKEAVVGAVETGAAGFLEDHADAKAFLVDRAKRAGELGEEYVLAKDDAGRARAIELLEVVRQSVANELSHIAVDASASARAMFGNVLSGALQVLKAVLPVLVSAL